ncbi:MAG: ankyrin repeat domain-containing protein [Gemmatimonadetes bacterium]|nr:ankyrin repeat domain-containing protein [Gemmatimonadota bacterium]
MTKMNRLRMLALLVIPAMIGAGSAPTTPIADAAMRGDLAAVRSLVASGKDVNGAQGDGMTALHWAADRGDLPMVEVLLKAKASVSATTRSASYTPLHIAAKGGHSAIMVALLNAGADPNVMTGSGATALHLASGSGATEGATALLDKGADPNVREKLYGQTPLIFAAEFNRAQTITMLIKRGANTAIKTRKINLAEETAADQAASKKRNEILISFELDKHPDSVRRLIGQGGADVPSAALASRGFTMQSLGFAALIPGAADAAGGGRGGAPAFQGGGGGRQLQGPQPKGPFTPAQVQQAIAAGRQVLLNPEATKGPVREVVDTINGGVAGFLNAVGAMGAMTPLHHAIRQGNQAAVDALLAGGADLNTPNDVDGTTPLLQAIINGHFDMALTLVKRGANVNTPNSANLAPLYATINTFWAPRSRFPQPQAVQTQKATHLELMDALLKAGAKTDVRLSSQFWYFAYNNCGNANCGLENITGTTPFWRAAYSLDVDAMKMLVKAGADVTVPSSIPAAGGRGGRGAPGGQQPSGAGVDPLIPFDPNAGGGGGGGGGRGQIQAGPPLDPAIDSASKAVPAGVGVFPIHAVAGVGYGNGFAGNAHRHAPDAWMASMKYVVEELHADVNARDNGGYTPMHHAAARGDNEMIKYLVSKGADVKAVARNGRTTVDMANGPVSRITPLPETIALLEKLGAKNSHKCASCW